MKREHIILVITILAAVIFVTYRLTSSFTIAEIKKLENSDDVHWVNYDSSRRGAFIWVNKKIAKEEPVMQFCAEPFPDISLDKDSSASLKNRFISFLISDNVESKILPGRNSGVLALREALYRLCELSVNRPKIDNCQIMEEYKLVIEHLVNFTDSEATRNNAEADRIISSSPKYDVQLAKESEKKGFESIIDRKYTKAKDYFSKAEKYYPTLHNNFEIYSALNTIGMGDVDDSKKSLSEREQNFLNDIISKWSWGADTDQMAKIKKLLADKSTDKSKK